MSHGHGHSPEQPWRPASRVRQWLVAALAPFAVITVVSLVTLWPSAYQKQGVPLPYTTYGEGNTVFERGRVVALDEKACDPAAGSAPGTLSPSPAGVCGSVAVLVGTGPDTGRTVALDPSGLKLQVGDRIRITRGSVTDSATGARTYGLDDYDRDIPLAVIAALFTALLFAVARWRGLAALAGVGVAYLILVLFMIPALLDGRSPVAVAVTGSAAILFVVLYLAHGVSSRTSTALLGTLSALAVTAGLASVATSAAHLTGRSSDINGDLVASGVHVSITGLILCGLIVGALGVLNDVTVTQASAVWELSALNPAAGWRRLFTGGMRIGRDHIASTVYTLVFAYAGAALPLLLLFSVSGRSVHDLITGDEIGGEIVRALVGGAGLILAVPLTTFIAALVAARPHEPSATDDDRVHLTASGQLPA